MIKYFEDIQIGDVYALGRHTFTADDIKAFARRFDPQRFHVDEAQAQQSHFGALCASGWHTAVTWMRLMLEHRRGLAEAAHARGETVPSMSPALGLRDLKWHRPVYAGDTIDYRSEVTELRISNSKPGHGLMTILSTGANQNGELVISFLSTTLVERRPERP